MPPIALQENVLFYGDNLDILRRYIPDESIDLIYLDPPFNSKADYNILFKEVSGEESLAQIRAFTDFWHWDAAARKTYDYLTGNEVANRVATVADVLHRLLGKNDMTAYLFMMTIRLIELRRVLKSTGSIFLHCDPTASHYLKMVMDAVFDPRNFRNEIVWIRSYAKGLAFTRFASNHDTILFYTKDAKSAKWHMPYSKYDPKNIPTHYKPDKNGRPFQLTSLLNPNLDRPNLRYEFKGVTRVWRWTKERMLEEDRKGRIVVPKEGKGIPRYLRYLDEQEGMIIPDVWTDIFPVNSQAKERLGYPTQKPTALLERIIEGTTDKGDWILDPFCGCGTAIEAAEKLDRHWIGIDITYLAINIIKNRMHGSFPRARFRVEGEPQDLEAARELATDRYQFQWWALMRIGARPVGASSGQREGKKGADEGVDGWMRFTDGQGALHRIVVQVKSGHVWVKDIRELRDTVSRQNASMGILITLEEPTSEMVKEVKATEPFKHPTWQHEYPRLQILTVEDLLKGKAPDIPPTIGPFQEASISKKVSEGKNDTLF